MVRVRLDLAYDGTQFAGWARQPALRTVQGVLEDGLEQIVRTAPRGLPAPRLTVAGRTDAGVHARGQVAHVDLPVERWVALPGRSDREPGESLVTRLTGVLPPDVVVHRAALAPAGFDARFSALYRRYAFRIADDAAARDPLHRAHVLWHRRPLDVAAMHDAVQPLRGVRDFAAYCKPRPGATTIRELKELSWTRPADGPDAGLVVARVVADAFCHNMVRALVGASIAVGEGRKPVSWPAEVLASKQRERAAAVVPPRGLTLEEVVYPPDADLAGRADRIRALRTDEDVTPFGG
ncbi:tRNA pseudouridine synthase A [Xylanimonas cellulosilytica DSM 15894]|uniref:tRNA pseudouridine synthase A n=1 Tax=Xylanimonas cellulosilytica (strain DSM 15894 / JCM 12276 / CECT 5975 / KCTC 9989 / LMG 20990 / NBRC 107835 / XIL07) TaxID=446471 RepID=D1BWW5_XYLCX|nr:tRNA pseudouridine(38-40) synthase TruA [Xylanimonas cellulosilytica]ACZ29697.1 tRNA pseudouridine synthase A [Xylanimonas cellulosilytica DSM 15894]